MLWAEKWRRISLQGGPLPGSAFEALDACDSDMFPSISTLLAILATLPVSVATAERSFSTLRRVKTWLRSRMGDERLNGLCLLAVHREMHLDMNSIIDRFAKRKNRRLNVDILL